MTVRLVLLVCMFGLHRTYRKCDEERICKTHTMCIFKERVACDWIMNTVNVNRDLEIFITHIHNTGRNVVALGMNTPLVQLVGPHLPSSNMKRLYWDETLAMYAQRYANSCYVTHTDLCRDILRKGKRRPVGQLVARFFVPEWISRFSPDMEIKFAINAISSWYFTGRFVTEDIIKKYQPYLNDTEPFKAILEEKDYRGYTQLMWARTYKLGCGFISYHGNRGIHYVLVCNYYPAGNIPGKEVYHVGNGCTKCKKLCNRMFLGLCSKAVSVSGCGICIFSTFIYIVAYNK